MKRRQEVNRRYIVGERCIEHHSGDQQKGDRDAVSDSRQKQTQTQRNTETQIDKEQRRTQTGSKRQK